MFYTVPDTLLTFFIYFEATQAGFNVNPDHTRVYACAFLTFFLLLSAFNFYWNVLFIRIAFEKINKKEDLNNLNDELKTTNENNEIKAKKGAANAAVSYTHLTLPTKA